jgi:hypothetical protein
MNNAGMLISNKDALLFALPFLVILFISMFRLDQLIATPRRAVMQRPSAADIDKHGEPILRDPDGRSADPGAPDRRIYLKAQRAQALRGRRIHWVVEAMSAQDEA